MAKKSKHYLPQEKGKDKLTTINPADKKGPGRNNVKIRDYGKKPAEPDAVHHRHPRPRGQVSSALTGQEVPDSGKVSTGQSDRWASRGGVRTGAHVILTEGDNFWMKNQGIKAAAEDG